MCVSFWGGPWCGAFLWRRGVCVTLEGAWRVCVDLGERGVLWFGEVWCVTVFGVRAFLFWGVVWVLFWCVCVFWARYVSTALTGANRR